MFLVVDPPLSGRLFTLRALGASDYPLDA